MALNLMYTIYHQKTSKMTLSDNWFMEGYVDFELQKYRLLAYLQEVKRHFNQTKLYPQLSDLVTHYNNLISFRKNKQLLQRNFPRKINYINPNKLEIVYERILADSNLMSELEEITEFALSEMEVTVHEGTDLYEIIEKQICVEPVGIMPIYKNEGYLLIKYLRDTDVKVYNYIVTLFEHKDAKYKGIKLEYIDIRTKNYANTYEQIKLDLIRDIRILPNPAVYKIEYPLSIPYNETLLPVAKRVLVKMLG